MNCPADHSLYPVLPLDGSSECRYFDFSLTFEEVIFALTPSLLALPCISLGIYIIIRRPILVVWPSAQIAKLCVFAVLGALQLAELGIYATGDGCVTTNVTVISCVAVLLAIIGAAILSALEHGRSPRPALIIQSYLFLTLLLDIPRLRTRWLLWGQETTASLQSASLAVKAVLLLIESLPKGKHLSSSVDFALSPEDKAGLFSKSFLLWLMPLFLRGYRHVLYEPDLFTVGEDLTATRLTKRVHEAWENTGLQRKRRLALAMVKAFIPQLVTIQVARLSMVGFAIAQPFLVQTSLDYIVHHVEKPAEIGYSLIAAFALVYTGVALCTLWSQHQTYRLLTMIRGSLTGMIFRHSLILPAVNANDSSHAVTLMSTDMERIVATLQWVLNVFPNTVQVGLGLWILHSHLGVVFVAPLLLAILCSIGAGSVGKRTAPRQREWMQAIQARIRVITNVVNNIKGYKMSGLRHTISDQVQRLRTTEIEKQKAFRRYQVANIALGNMPGMLTPAVTFSAFAIAQLVTRDSRFDVVTAFTSLSLLSILINPVAELVTSTTHLASALNCLDRIQDYLQMPVGDISASGSSGIVQENERSDASAFTSGDTQDSLIHIADATIGWEATRPVLHGINLHVHPSKFIMVTGPIGCGKSTLLRTLLGETSVISGSVEQSLPRKIAYCDQEPWIQNISIRRNIIGISKFNEERYQTVVQACQLLDDFEQLPAGDDTLAGSRGTSLSGGQKHRVSLARAAYSGKPLIIVDDALSGLDTNTAAQCFKALFGESGLFRRESRTIVFASHNVNWMTYADEIVVLGKDGRISDTGNLNVLSRTNTYVQELRSISEVQTGKGEETSFVATIEQQPKVDITTKPAARSVRSPLFEHASQKQSVGALHYYMSSIGYGILVFMFLTLLQIGCATAQPVWLKLWVSENQLHPNDDVGKWAGVYLSFAVLTIMLITVGTGYFLLFLLPVAAQFLHRTLLDTTLSAPISFFGTHDTGVIVNFFTSDLNLTDLALPISLVLTLERLISTVAEIVLTCIASGYLAIAAPFIAVVLFCLQHVYLKTSRQLRRLELELKGPLFANFISTFSGLVTIRAFSWIAAVEEENMKLLDISQSPYYLLFCLQRWLTLVLDLVAAGLATLLITLAVSLRSTIDPGFLGVALVSVMNFGHIVSLLIMSWTNLETSLGAVSRIKTYRDETPSETKTESHHGDEHGTLTWPSRGELNLTDVSASYGDHKVLTDISLSIKPASKIVICGRTGSGKSTLLALLLRLLDPESGYVTIDGRDLLEIPVDQVRAALVTLPQEPLFLSGSVRTNLDPFGALEGDDEPLLQALDKVGLAAVIQDIGGLDMELKDEWLSIGQRQLFCLARAMLRKSPVLFLDEATSSLDAHGRRLLDQLLVTEFKDRTVVMITHDVQSVAQVGSAIEHVAVLRQGKIVEQGNVSSLLSRGPRGEFWQMVQNERDNA